MFADKNTDMGAVRGRFRFAPPAPKAPAVTGNYVTVWRKNDPGQWKGIVDIAHPD